MRWILSLALVAMLAPGQGWAQASQPTPKQIALAREMVEASGQRENLQGMMRAALAQMATEAGADLPPERRAETKSRVEAMNATMTKFAPKLLEVSVDAYARTFSEEELTQILAFQNSSVGKALRARSPELSRQIGVSMGQLMPQIQQDFRAEFCARETCPAQRAAPAKP
jgi:hypothetical protein